MCSEKTLQTLSGRYDVPFENVPGIRTPGTSS